MYSVVEKKKKKQLFDGKLYIKCIEKVDMK